MSLFEATGFTATYQSFALSVALSVARAALQPGSNIIAVHCQQTTGGQYIAIGLATAKKF